MPKKKISELKIMLVLLLGICLMYNIFYSDYIQKHFYYPIVHEATIDEVSQNYNINKYLLLAIIKNESKFNDKAVSAKGALGLMQIMPETGTWIAQSTNWRNFTPNSLTDPVINIKFGTWYLSELKHEFYQNDILALAAYNAGRGNVKSWVEKYNWDKNFSNISEIPFGETQVYIRRILNDKQMYAKYYDENNY